MIQIGFHFSEPSKIEADLAMQAILKIDVYLYHRDEKLRYIYYLS
jgi:hypothetical protein